MTRDEEITALREQIKAEDDATDVKRKRLRELYSQREAECAARVKRLDKFDPSELRFSADARCKECGAGLAYPLDMGPHGYWLCSADLLNGTGLHTTYPFAFFEIKSEGQPSANGRTTRPEAAVANAK